MTQQTHTPQEKYAHRQDALRAELRKAGVDGFFLSVADEYQGEYPPDSARRVAWLTGFVGSAGVVAVLLPDALDAERNAGDAEAAKAAAVFVDGRYTLQVRQQVDQSRYEPKDLMSEPLGKWAAQRLRKGARLAYDPWMHTQAFVENAAKELERAGIALVPLAYNPVDAVWADRPAIPCAPVFVHGLEYAGEEAAVKRRRVAAAMAENGADAAVLTAPDAIAWLLNIRGGDVRHTPLALSFALLHADATVDWFIHPDKVSDAVRAHTGAEVRIHPMEELEAAVDALGAQERKVLYDPARSAAWFHQRLTQAGARIIAGDDPCLLPKACKNEVEIEGIRRAHIRDGVAMTRFLHWLDTEAPQRAVTELEAEEKLLALRKQQRHFHEPSFDTIAGSGEHGAIVHYRATPQSNKVLERDSLFLLDSGGQYTDGTTDITRTTVIGTATDEQKRRFTQVLKGHIALACAVFPHGVAGQNLDVLARAPLWADGVDYAHGTGHGVGAYLGVHEGPQGIHARSAVPLRQGMVLSNEPGFYKEGEYGIRIENLIIVQPKAGTGGGNSRPYYAFETVTLAPVDYRLIEVALLSPQELDWLNAYHQRVYATLSPLLDGEEREWLKDMTQPLSPVSRAASLRETEHTVS